MSQVTPAAITPDTVKAFAPTGTLRVAINLGNSVLAQTDPTTGAPKGVTPELATELAKRLSVPHRFITFDAAGKVFDVIKRGEIDLANNANEPVRAAQNDKTPPNHKNEGVYMVPKGSALKSVADVDRAGIRIGVNKASAYDLFLTRTLKHATLMRGDDGVALFKAEKLEAAGGVKQPLVAYAKTDPDVRIMDGRFMEIRQAMGTPKGRTAAAQYLRGFVEEMKASGFVADALKRSNQPDAAVAPPER